MFTSPKRAKGRLRRLCRRRQAPGPTHPFPWADSTSAPGGISWRYFIFYNGKEWFHNSFRMVINGLEWFQNDLRIIINVTNQTQTVWWLYPVRLASLVSVRRAERVQRGTTTKQSLCLVGAKHSENIVNIVKHSKHSETQ